MMKLLINWGVKKYVLNIVNDVLDAKQGGVAKARAVVARYLVKADALIDFLKSLDAKLADYKLTDEEAEEVVNEAVALGEILVCGNGKEGA